MRTSVWFICIFLLSQTALGADLANLPDGVDPTSGFRIERYRAPVPSHIPGGTVLRTPEVMQEHKMGDMIFIDVYPPKGLGPDPLEGYWVTNEKHENIAGSTWLPEVGRGHLQADAEAYFRRNLQKLTQEDRRKRILFYCTADCWQSWNAARRAILWGFTNVYWFPDGTDGWLDYEQPLVAAKPVNFLE